MQVPELSNLADRWKDCQRCDLHKRREEDPDHHIVFGGGISGGIMVVGDGPDETEEKAGKPFVGEPGALLRKQLENFGLLDQTYFSNIVLCRHCEKSTWPSGDPKYRQGTKIRETNDLRPLEPHVLACSPRLLEEIYIVDPLIIVASGAASSETLIKNFTGVVKRSGSVLQMTVPGRTHVTSLTEKKRVWRRKLRGEFITPIEQFRVKYAVMPLVSPKYVIRNINDVQPNSPVRKFVAGIATIRNMLDMRRKIYGHQR